MKKIIISFLLLCNVFANDIPAGIMKLNISDFKKDDKSFIAVTFRNAPHWHTYWSNPGDAGLAIESSFIFNNEVETTLSPIEWPIPKRYIEDGDILTFGFEGEYTLFYEISESSKNSETKAFFKWLICKNICIPGQREADFQIIDSKINYQGNDFEVTRSILKDRFETLPQLIDPPEYFDVNLVKSKNDLSFIYNFNKSGNNLNSSNNIIIPYSTLPFSFKRESIYKDKDYNIYGKYTVDWDGQYMEPEMPLPEDGKFSSPHKFKFLVNDPVSGNYYVIKKEISSFAIDDADNFSSFISVLSKIEPEHISTKIDNLKDEEDMSNFSIIYFLIMAFIGGLILNIMPCVLPVISIKLFGLISHRNESKKSIFKHNIAYTAGVFVTFALLAATIIFLKKTGETIGWGFQLQSPLFVSIMIVIIFIMALNLFGLFEFKTPGGRKLGGIELRDSFKGDFIGGVLATILSTPCSAPFLGTALTFAFGESNLTIFYIFNAIALGLSSPFLLTAFFPRLIKFLPRPGKWMENIKKFLGLTLLLTTIWLLDVFSALSNTSLDSLRMHTVLSLIFFIFYLRAKISKKLIYTFFFLVPTIYLFISSQSFSDANIKLSSSTMVNDKNSNSEIKWEVWSEEKMNSLMQVKKITFIDFTAKWCITCKVNEKLVIDTSSFEQLAKENNISLLLADWTKRDPVIGKWLQKNGHVGVPAYFIINDQGELINLGETITIGEIKEKIKGK